MAFSTLKLYLVGRNSTKSHPLNDLWDILSYSNFLEYLEKNQNTVSINTYNLSIESLYRLMHEGTPLAAPYTATCRDSLIGILRRWAQAIQGTSLFDKTSINLKVVCRLENKVPFTQEYFEYAQRISGLVCVKTAAENEFGFYLRVFDPIKFSMHEFLLRSTDFLTLEDLKNKNNLIEAILKNDEKCFPNNGSESVKLAILLAFGVYTSKYTTDCFSIVDSKPWAEGVSFKYVNGASSGMELYLYQNLGIFLDFVTKFKITPNVLQEEGFQFPFHLPYGDTTSNRFKNWNDLIVYWDNKESKSNKTSQEATWSS